MGCCCHILTGLLRPGFLRADPLSYTSILFALLVLPSLEYFCLF